LSRCVVSGWEGDVSKKNTSLSSGSEEEDMSLGDIAWGGDDDGGVRDLGCLKRPEAKSGKAVISDPFHENPGVEKKLARKRSGD
jgi:hypothetical protein